MDWTHDEKSHEWASRRFSKFHWSTGIWDLGNAQENFKYLKCSEQVWNSDTSSLKILTKMLDVEVKKATD